MTIEEQRYLEECKKVLKHEQMDIVTMAMDYGLPIAEIRKVVQSNQSAECMREIVFGMMEGISTEALEFLCENDFNQYQMKEIREGIVHGLAFEQVKTYAIKEMSANRMKKMRTQLEESLQKQSGQTKEDDSVREYMKGLMEIMENSILQFKERMIIPVGYVAYEYPKYKRREVNKYVRKYSDIENCISYDVMKYMMENAHLYPTLEMADNALSRYIAQKGKCAVTHNALSISDMVCVHIKPCKGERNDTYRNLIILSKEVSELVGATNPVKIGKLLKDLQLTEEMKDKINKLRKHRELEEIQFEDYIGTKK